MIAMAENLSIIFNNLPGVNESSNQKIKQALNYMKSMLASNKIDKIRLILDSKAPIYLISYLNTEDIQIRTQLIEIFLEISKGFQQLQFSYAKTRGSNMEMKSVEEISKNLGIVAHINMIDEDKISRAKFLDFTNDYYYLKQQINKAFSYQLAFVFESPVLFNNLFCTLKSKSELTQNKILLIQIISNLL